MQEFRRADSRLSPMLKANPRPAAIIDNNGVLLALNLAAATFLRTPEDARDLEWGDVWPSYLKEAVAGAACEARVSGHAHRDLSEWNAGRAGERWELEIDALGDGTLFACWRDTDWRQANDLLKTAFRDAVVGKAIVGLDGAFLGVNPALCRLLGLEEAELLATSFQAVTHPDDLDADLSLLKALVAGAIPDYRMDKRYLHADGRAIWANLAVSLVRDRDGRPLHFVSQVADIGERKAAEQALQKSEERYRLIAENTTDVIVAADQHGVVTFMTPTITPLTGFAPAEIIGRPSLDFVHADDRHLIKRATSDVATGRKRSPVRWRFRHKTEGRWVWVESNPARLTGFEPGINAAFVDVVRDVGLQVEQEQALARAMKEAEAAALAKSEFLATMSHEIRTPLTSVLGFSSLLAEQPDLSPAARRYVERVRAGGATLLALVNDILDFSKLEAGQVEIRPTPTDIEPLIQSALDLFSAQADAKDIKLAMINEMGSMPWLELDPDRLRQIVINLVGNAVKFTRAGRVTVRISYAADSHLLRVAVEDTGPGLTQEQQGKLFERFSQVDGSMTRQFGGTGLGLAICRGLAEAMGGSTWLTSQVGRGSIFGCDIPARIVNAPAQDQLEQAVLSLAGVRVLVVDDHPVNRELARLVLGGAGVDIHEAESGEDAIALAAAQRFDVILMDFTMPGMDGRTAASRIRLRGPNRNTPILAFTAGVDVLQDGANGVFDGAIAKPIAPAALIAHVYEAVGSFRAEDRVQGSGQLLGSQAG